MPVTDFDPATLGLETHYNGAQRDTIRRLMLEDWKASDLKLPTYMKIVARTIIPCGIPEDWLTKLSHQTMAKMLKGTSTPRQDFWMALHLYLIQKYGDIGISDRGSGDIDVLGRALSRFGKTKAGDSLSHAYLTNDGLAIQFENIGAHQRVYAIERQQSAEAFSEPSYCVMEGTCIVKGSRVVGMLRGVAGETLIPLNATQEDLKPLEDEDLLQRLERMAERYG